MITELTVPAAAKTSAVQLSAARAVQFSQCLVGGIRMENRCSALRFYSRLNSICASLFLPFRRAANSIRLKEAASFCRKYQGKTILWGATAAHIARAVGREVTVTFHLHGRDVSFPAEIVLTGRKYGLNAALIKLPPEAVETARPVVQAETAPIKGDLLFTYGFSAGQYKKRCAARLRPTPNASWQTFRA